MHRTEVMSFPRSGWRLNSRLVRGYFEQPEFKGNTIYTNPSDNMDTNAAITFQKNHDFGLNTPVKKDRHYLVLIRYPIESLVSWYKLEENIRGLLQADWERFALDKIEFWKGFYSKWVLQNNQDNKHVLNYGVLMQNPFEELCKVIKFLSEDGREIDTKKIQSVVDTNNIKRLNDFHKFKYYNKKFFDKLRSRVQDVKGIDVKNDILVIN